MYDERRQQLMEQYEEAAISLLMDELAEAEGGELLREFEEASRDGTQVNIPEALDAKCQQLIEKTFAARQRKTAFSRLYKGVAKAAVYALVLVGILTTTVLSVEAFRIPVMNFFYQIGERSTAIAYKDVEKEVQALADWNNKISFAPIPSEYQLVLNITEDNGTRVLSYENESGNPITLIVRTSTGFLNVDTESADQKPMQLNNYEAVVIETEGIRVVWIDPANELTFDLYAECLEADVFWKIAYYWAS